MKLIRVSGLVWLFYQLDRLFLRTHRLFQVVRDEILWTWVDPNERDAINAAMYGNDSGYLRGGRYFRHGLFDWETRALTSHPFPKSGRILLGGAGGGRELDGIAKLGFDVTAFEPSEFLLNGAQEVAKNYPGSIAIQASYADLVLAIQSGTGPLASAIHDATITGIVLGWGSVSHLLTVEDRQTLLKALRQHFPMAPLLLSFLAKPDLPPGMAESVRIAIESVFRWIGKPTTHSLQDAFLPGSGFTHLYSLEEIRDLAAQTGYRTVVCELTPYPHAVLEPKNED